LDISNDLPEILIESEDADLALRLVEWTSSGSSIGFIARAQYRGSRVGFKVLLASTWKTTPIEGADVDFYQGSVILESLGTESDNWVRLLAKVYGIAEKPAGMKTRVKASAIGLAGDPMGVKTNPLALKLFFPSHKNAEAFLDVDAARSLVEFKEKDSGYRKLIVQALSGDGTKQKPWWRIW
jgi:hypothetical protein